MTKSGKVWGETQLIVANDKVQMHRIQVREGGFCSRHRHRHRYNGFYVLVGHLRVTVVKQYGPGDHDVLEDATDLTSGQYMEVPPGDYHWFEGITDTTAFELYWTPKLDPNDIERASVGGRQT